MWQSLVDHVDKIYGTLCRPQIFGSDDGNHFAVETNLVDREEGLIFSQLEVLVSWQRPEGMKPFQMIAM